MKRRLQQSSKKTSKRQLPEVLNAYQHSLVDYLRTDLKYVQQFFRWHGAITLPFFDVYLHKADRVLSAEEKRLCQWYFLLPRNALLPEMRQFLLLKQISEKNYRFLFDMLLRDNNLFWDCSHAFPTSCRMQRLLKHLVRLDCEWALTAVIRLVEQEKAILRPPHNLLHNTRVAQRTWRRTFPLKIWKVYGKRILLFLPGNPHSPFFSMTPQLYQRTEFTLEDLQQLPESVSQSLLAKRLRYAFQYPDERSRDYFAILAAYNTDRALVWEKMLNTSDRPMAAPALCQYRALARYVKQHPPTPRMCQSGLDILVMVPEYALLLFNHTPNREEPNVQIQPFWSQFFGLMWAEITIEDLKPLLYRSDRTVSTIGVWRGFHRYQPADYCLFKALQAARSELVSWILKNFKVTWFDLDALPSLPLKALSTALAYKKVVRVYLVETTRRFENDTDLAWYIVTQMKRHIEKDPLKSELVPSLNHIRRERQRRGLEVDPTVERLYELALEAPVV